MLDYAEKRDFPRMCIDCATRFRVAGDAQVVSCVAKDLSSSGLMLRSGQELPAGTQINVEIRPGKNITPPLYAEAEVVRCDQEGEDFAVACVILRMLPEEEVPLDFP
ncbi:MAG: PilZ domain-containing protein [Gammaproteobacteria bacterium]|nr:PilZ domain-containing protein [Gammaproteobacteria bacterium]